MDAGADIDITWSTRPLTRNERSARKRAWISPVRVTEACRSRGCTISVRTIAARVIGAAA